MKNFKREKIINFILSAAAIVLMWLVWLIAYFAVGNEYIIPSVGDTFISLWHDCFINPSFWKSFLNTLLRTVLSYAASFLLAGALTSLCVAVKRARAAIAPVMAFLRTLPTLAVILILLLWTNPRTAPVIVTSLVLFPMLYARFIAAADGVDEGIKQVVKVYGVPKGRALFKVYLPLMCPSVLPQTGSDISLGLKVMVSAEVLSNTYMSLGGMMQQSKLYLEVPRLAALTIAVVVAGVIIDAALSNLSRITDRWAKKEQPRD